MRCLYSCDVANASLTLATISLGSCLFDAWWGNWASLGFDGPVLFGVVGFGFLGDLAAAWYDFGPAAVGPVGLASSLGWEAFGACMELASPCVLWAGVAVIF